MRIQRITTCLSSALLTISVLHCSTLMANSETNGGNSIHAARLLEPTIDTQTSEPPKKPMVTALSTLDSMAMGSAEIPLNPEVDSKRYKQVDTGNGTACGIRSEDAGIDCFGFNAFGQASPPKGKFKSISMGGFHGCAITKESKLVCWGEKSSYPKEEETKGHRYRQVSSGTDHTCAIDFKEAVTCWGDNTLGETDAPMGRFIDISAHGDHSCAINKANNIQCWGDKAFLSEGPFIGSYSQLSTGVLHLCALRTSDQQAVCWGNNAYGQSTPSIGAFKNLVSGIAHTCGHREDGTVSCWGRNQYGQTDTDNRRYRFIAAGGNQTCLLSFPNSHLSCLGSFKFNDTLFSIPGQNAELEGEDSETVSAQNSMGDFIGNGVNWFGSSVAEGLEALYTPDLNKLVKYAKFGNVVFGFASLLLSNLLEEPDPNAERYKQIQKDLENIKLQLTDIKASIDVLIAESRSTAYIVSAQWCSSSRAPLDALAKKMQDSGVSFVGPAEQWKGIIDKYQRYLTDAENNKGISSQELNSIYKEIDDYRARWFNPTNPQENLEAMSTQLHNSLINQAGAEGSPLDICKTPAWEAWRTQNNLYPYDDRYIWSESYKVLIRSMTLQDQIADIQTQMAVLDLARALQEPLTMNDKPVAQFRQEVKPGEWEGMGICTKAEQVWNGTYIEPNPDNAIRLKRAWNTSGKIQADGPCANHKALIKQIYTQQVKQLEYMGGAYSSRDIILSLTSEQMGVTPPKDSEKQSNWLWFRPYHSTNLIEEKYSSMPETRVQSMPQYVEKISAKGWKKDASPYLDDPAGGPRVNNFPLYLTRKNDQGQLVYGEYVWHSNGKAWVDAHRARLDQKLSKADEKEVLEDFIEKLSTYPSYDYQTDASGKMTKQRRPLFENIKGLAFWMPLNEEVYVGQPGSYQKVVLPIVSFQKYDVAYKQAPVNRIKPDSSIYDHFAPPCFMAGKSNSGAGADGADAWFLDDQKQKQFLKLSGKVCASEEVAALLRPNNQLGWKNGVDCRTDGRCAGIGVGFPSNKYFDKFNSAFGGNFGLTYELWGKISSGMYFTEFYGLYDMVNKMSLHHLPVVKITDIPCSKSLLPDENGAYETRQGTRSIPAKNVTIPSVCGEDLDKIINSMVPKSPYLNLTDTK